MLFTGGGTAAKAIKDEKKEKKPEKDDRFDIQEATFIRWANSISVEPIKDLSSIMDAKFFSNFVTLITNESLEPSGSRANDVLKALRMVDPDEKFSQTNLNELIDGNPRTICSVIWQLIQIYWKRFAPEDVRDQKLTEAIKVWCIERLKNFDEIQINDFTSSWRDGYAINAILLSYDTELFSLESVREMRGDERIEHAMDIADRLLNVPRLLNPKHFHSEHLDMKSVVTYLMTIYLAINARMPVETSDQLRTEIDRVPKSSNDENFAQSTASRSHTEDVPTKTTSISHTKSVGSSDRRENTAALCKLTQEQENSSTSVTSQPVTTTENVEIVPSRKSSISSQKSGRRSRKLNQENVAEYEQCVEQVLAWLLAAEEQANNMGPIEEDIDTVKIQFREHEQFMQSLTESQDSVGRVLHRGKALCQKLEEEQSSSILSQLYIVNARWEKIRDIAMNRQNHLQIKLDSLQMEQLEAVQKWMDIMESEIARTQPLCLNAEEAAKQISLHEIIQENIDKEQKIVRKLSTFVAVIDENELQYSYDNLEKLLHKVGERWMTICEWAEHRARQLDGLPELVIQYQNALEQLLDWLTIREEEITKLRSVHHLISEAEILEQVDILQKVEAALESGHEDFISLSQLAMELVAKLDDSNGLEANNIRRQLDIVTQRWDNIVTRIDEHSHMLVKSGKADARVPCRSNANFDDSDELVGDIAGPTNSTGKQMIDEFVVPTSTVQFSPSFECLEPKSNDTSEISTDSSSVNRFITNVQKLSDDLQPLMRWTHDFEFENTGNLHDIRALIQVCQGKLREIKDREESVNNLHCALERLHTSTCTDEEIQLANNEFESFTKNWSRIVTRISDALNILSYHADDLCESAEDETDRILLEIQDFFDLAGDIIVNCAHISSNERELRLLMLDEQFDEQEKNIAFLEMNHPDKQKVELLKNRVQDFKSLVKELQENAPLVARFNDYLNILLNVGDITQLIEALNEGEELLNDIKKSKSEKEKFEHLEHFGDGKLKAVIDLLPMVKKWNDKSNKIEALIMETRDRLDSLRSKKKSISEVLYDSEMLRTNFEDTKSLRKEYIELSDQFAATILVQTVLSKRETILDSLKVRTHNTNKLWNGLEEELDENISILKKENKKVQQNSLRTQVKLVEEANRAINASREAADAEEFSEYLDTLENIYEKISNGEFSHFDDVEADEPFSKEIANLRLNRDETLKRIRERIDALELAIGGCEHFDSSLADCQAWCSLVNMILACRASTDVSALDVPPEYKSALSSGTLITQLQNEFDDCENCLKNLKDFVEKISNNWGSSYRLQLQLDHVAKQYEDLLVRFIAFKEPVAFEEKLELLSQDAIKMENNLDEFSDILPTACKEALEQAKEMEENIKKSKFELERLHESRQTLLDNQLFDLDALNTKFFEINTRLDVVENRRSELEAKLQECVVLVDEYNNILEQVDSQVDKLDLKLTVLIETATVNSRELSEYKFDLDRLDSLLRSIDNIVITLKKYSINISNEDKEKYFERIERLKSDFSALMDLINANELEKTSQSKHFDATYRKLLFKTRQLENCKDMKDLRIALNNDRMEFELLMENIQVLLSPQNEIKAKQEQQVSEMKKRRNDMVIKSEQSSQPLIPRLPPLSEIIIVGDFQEKIIALQEIFHIAQEYLNFDKYPFISKQNWEERIQGLDDWLLHYNDELKAVLEKGRELASNGRMELDIHDALDNLDKVVDIANQVENDLKNSKVKLMLFETKSDALDRDIQAFKEILDQLEARDLTDLVIAKATRHDLSDREKQLDQLRNKINDLQESLPTVSHNLQNKDMDELLKRVQLIEDKISSALKDEILDEISLSAEIQKQDSKEMDALSVTSVERLSLALEVQDTEDERSRLEYVGKNTVIKAFLLADDESISADLVYCKMDELEEFLLKEDAFPFDDLENKLDNISLLKKILEKFEKAIEDSQMTMDLLEYEAAKDRLGTLHGLLGEYEKKSTEYLFVMENFNGNLITCENSLKEIEKSLGDIDARNKSPEIDELESLAINLEDHLQRAFAQIQHTSVKAEPLLTQMSDKNGEEIKSRMMLIGENWKNLEKKVSLKRKKVDERQADESELSNEIELLEFWCDETEVECATGLNHINITTLAEMRKRVEDRICDYDAKHASLYKIELLKDRIVNAEMIDASEKHRTRRLVSGLGERITMIRDQLHDRKKILDDLFDDIKTIENDLAKLSNFSDRCEKAIQIFENAKIFVPSGVELDFVRSHANEMDTLAANIRDKENRGKIGEIYIDNITKKLIDEALIKFDLAKERLADVSNLQTLACDSSYSELSVGTEEQGLSEDISTKSKGSILEQKVSFLDLTAEQEVQSSTEYGTLDHSITSETVVEPILSPSEQKLLDTIIHLGHWLSEVSRDASVIVDIVDARAIRNVISKIQIFIDQLKLRYMDVVRILSESQSTSVRCKTELLISEWNRLTADCQHRKCVLNKMVDESRIWDQSRCSIQLWLTEAQEKLNKGGKVNTSSEKVLSKELKEIEEMSEEVIEMKSKMEQLNSGSNALLDTYRTDEGHNLSHMTSSINALWSRFNDNIRIRRAVLEAALRSKTNFRSALDQLELWLERIDNCVLKLDENTSNIQVLRDPIKRKQLSEEEKSLRIDMDAQSDIVKSVEEMGKQLIRSMDNVEEKNNLNERLEALNKRWRKTINLREQISQRLVSVQEEWEKLISQISENLFWIETQSTAIFEEQPVGGSLVSVQRQNQFIKKLEREIRRRQKTIDECLTLSRSYLMQHDLRPRMHTPSVLSVADQPIEIENSELRRAGLQIKSESDNLAKKWSELKVQADAWSKIIDEIHEKMEKMASALAECQLALSNMEARMELLKPVEELCLDELVNAADETNSLKELLTSTRVHIDDANDWSGQLLAADVDLDLEPNAQLKSVNDRLSKLKSDLKIRMAALDNAVADFGPSSQHFLMNSVREPWQRTVSVTNHLPYYINHETEITQWDHPVMVSILEELTSFNQIKFSAYRTAMKLRTLQKRLCLDLLNLHLLDEKLKSLNGVLSERTLAIKDAVICLVPLFESVHEKFPQLIKSIPLAVDLFLNFLLNIYDTSRDGALRTLSFKVVLFTLCNANLEDKYKCLYNLVATSDGVDQKRLALLLHDIIQIPKFLGEAAAFGGSNVEPSVRSCFEMTKFSRTVTADDFLRWLKKEPQSIVWLPVMHRLASAEFAKHQAKCNICKMFPIIGLRYRCLKCFNIDICQNCFFSQRIAKNHKLSHPMQEYCFPTTSGEDVRDFGIIVRNKFRSRSRSKTGYLPVQSVDEGVPLEANTVIPTNPSTEPLHNRLNLCAQRLWKVRSQENTPIATIMDADEALPVESTGTVEIKSPLQLLSQVEQMHKEELDQVLYKLQHENRELKKEIERRKNFQGVGSTPNLNRSAQRTPMSMITGRSVPSLPNTADEQMLKEAFLLRQHKERLEQRSRILEEQNRQLEVQLARLQMIITQQGTGEFEKSITQEERELSVTSKEEDEGIEYDHRPNRMHSLIASVDQLGRAMQSLVVSMVNVDDPKEDEDDELMDEIN